MKFFLLLTLFASPVLAAYNAPIFTLKESEIISNLRCFQKVSETLKDWKFTGEWSKHLSHAENNGVILNSPTFEFATWVSLNIVNSEVSMELVKPMAVKRITFTKNCDEQTEIQFPKPTYSLKNRFTDEALKKYMEENPKGLIYVWSANMPWSVEGMDEVREAAKALHVPVKIVMSPQSDAKLTADLLAQKKITKEDTEMHASLEFVMRGMTIHDPSILAFNNGKLSRWARPGRETKTLLVKFYSKELK